jgi:hypothetical protein
MATDKYTIISTKDTSLATAIAKALYDERLPEVGNARIGLNTIGAYRASVYFIPPEEWEDERIERFKNWANGFAWAFIIKEYD